MSTGSVWGLKYLRDYLKVKAEDIVSWRKLTELPRQEKEDLILQAVAYRSGEDSCGSVYMGSMALSSLRFSLSGVPFNDKTFRALLDKASIEQVNDGLAVCHSYIKYMEANPRVRCPCCNQITDPRKLNQ